MMIRVPMIGSGADGDAYRVALPTWRLVLATYTQNQAIIEIPDDEIAALITSLGPTITNVPTIGPVVTALPAGGRAQVLAAIRAKYRERAPGYDIAPA